MESRLRPRLRPSTRSKLLRTAVDCDFLGESGVGRMEGFRSRGLVEIEGRWVVEERVPMGRRGSLLGLRNWGRSSGAESRGAERSPSLFGS